MKYVLIAKQQMTYEIITKEEKNLRALRSKSNKKKPGKFCKKKSEIIRDPQGANWVFFH